MKVQLKGIEFDRTIKPLALVPSSETDSPLTMDSTSGILRLVVIRNKDSQPGLHKTNSSELDLKTFANGNTQH